MQELLLNYGEDLQFYLFFGFVLIFLLAERIRPKRPQIGSQKKRWQTNAGLTLVAILVLPIMPVSFITVAYWAEVNEFGLLNSYAGSWPILVLVLVTLLLRGFISTITHLLSHKIPLLWRFHRVHHMDTELDVSSTVRFHPLEMPLSMLVGLPMVAAFGLPPWILLFYELFDVTVTLFSHSNLRIPPKLNRYLQYVIVTPNLHTVHHSSYQPETDSNYSAVFPIWDVLFGTFRNTTRQDIETMPLGLDSVSSAEANNFWKMIKSPFMSPLPHSPAQSPVTEEVSDSYIV